MHGCKYIHTCNHVHKQTNKQTNVFLLINMQIYTNLEGVNDMFFLPFKLVTSNILFQDKKSYFNIISNHYKMQYLSVANKQMANYSEMKCAGGVRVLSVELGPL